MYARFLVEKDDECVVVVYRVYREFYWDWPILVLAVGHDRPWEASAWQIQTSGFYEHASNEHYWACLSNNQGQPGQNDQQV